LKQIIDITAIRRRLRREPPSLFVNMRPPEERRFSACNANVAFFDGVNDATPGAVAGVVTSAVFFTARTDLWLGYPV
jgi:hypothetical protein